MESTAITEKKRILVVDDEYSIREALNMFFEGRGFETKLAANGLDALNIVEKEDFDIIISDIRMDKMDGVSLIKKLRQSNKKVPVIFITAFPELENAVEAIRNGVVEYIVKPFDMNVVGEKVEAAIKTRRESSDEHYNKLYREQKQKFLNRFSHELRTPLTPVAGYITLLLKKEFGDIPRQQLDIIQNIARNSDRLKSLVDDLMLLYAIENADEPMALKKYPVTQLISSAVSYGQQVIKEKNQTLDVKMFDGVESVYCDIKKVSRALHHLVDNASKYAPEKAEIEISIRSYNYESNEFVKFSVRDSGDPITGIDRREIFRQFYNINKFGDDLEVNKAVKGLGIGLTLSRAIVEAHCGRIWIEEPAQPKSGNIFSFILPVM
jgi:signal transduction histidine kinase